MFRINLQAASLAIVLSLASTAVAMNPTIAGVVNDAPHAGQGVRHLGTIGGSTPKYFTVNLAPRSSRNDAEVVAKYFKNFGLSVRIADNNEILFVHGTHGQAGAA